MIIVDMNTLVEEEGRRGVSENVSSLTCPHRLITEDPTEIATIIAESARISSDTLFIFLSFLTFIFLAPFLALMLLSFHFLAIV